MDPILENLEISEKMDLLGDTNLILVFIDRIVCSLVLRNLLISKYLKVLLRLHCKRYSRFHQDMKWMIASIVIFSERCD